MMVQQILSIYRYIPYIQYPPIPIEPPTNTISTLEVGYYSISTGNG